MITTFLQWRGRECFPFFYSKYKYPDNTIINIDTGELLTLPYSNIVTKKVTHEDGRTLIVMTPNLKFDRAYQCTMFQLINGSLQTLSTIKLPDIEPYYLQNARLINNALWYRTSTQMSIVPTDNWFTPIMQGKTNQVIENDLYDLSSQVPWNTIYNFHGNQVIVNKEIKDGYFNFSIKDFDTEKLRNRLLIRQKLTPKQLKSEIGAVIVMFNTRPDYMRDRIYFNRDKKIHYYDLSSGLTVVTEYDERYEFIGSTTTHTYLMNPNTCDVVTMEGRPKAVITNVGLERVFNAAGKKLPNQIRLSSRLNDDYSGLSSFAVDHDLIYVKGEVLYKLGKDANARYTRYGGEATPSECSVDSTDVNFVKVSYPSHFIELSTGKITLLPNVHWFIQGKSGEFYVICSEDGKENPNLYIRKFANGRIVKNDDDPVFDYRSYKMLKLTVSSNAELMLSNNEQLIYLIDNKWHSFDLNKLTTKEEIFGALVIGNNLILGLRSKMVVVDQEGVPRYITERWGAPEGRIFLGESKGRVLVVCGQSLYLFRSPTKQENLVIPGYWVNEKAYSSSMMRSFNHSTRTIRFPIFIINSLYPEKCQLEYKLSGYNKYPVQIPFTPELRFDGLKPGFYRLTVTATTEMGHKLHSPTIEFRILHPFYLTWWAYLIYSVLAGLGVFYLIRWRTRQLKKRNQDLEQTVEERTAELKERQLRIQESIEYAALIQKSILPQQEEMIRLFRKHFVIWQPRDIVGGDFYWMHAVSSDTIFFAVIDCTGHGVPGALLSMTVNAVLDKLVRDIGMREPGQILSTMHSEIGKALHQDMEHTQQDGIEIALLRFDKAADEVCFSGAGLHLLHKSGGSLHHIRGSKYGLGGIKWHSHLNFSETTLSYSKSDLFYLYTDGIVDQPVENIDKPIRMGHTQWLEFISSISDKPFIEQQESCKNLIDDMLKVHKQRDDITIIGLAL